MRTLFSNTTVAALIISLACVVLWQATGGDYYTKYEVVEQIDPRIVIPMHYKIPGLKVDIADIEPFLNEVGTHNEAQESLKLKHKSDLPTDTTEFVVLKPQLG